MAKTNRFHVREFEENRITVEEERRNRSPLILFFIKNGKLLFAISALFSIAVFIIAIALSFNNMQGSYIVKYESNGVVVTFDKTDNSILNGTPITPDYANKLFDSTINSNANNVGVVIRVRESVLDDRTIVFYSDKTALIKYNNGGFMKVDAVKNHYGVNSNGILDKKANTIKVNGVLKENNTLGISMLYLSDGSIEITKNDDVIFIRNSDITNNDSVFYTNLSGVSIPVSEKDGYVYYSDGVIKEGHSIIVDGEKYAIKKHKNIHDDIKIKYYENGYAEITKGELSVMVKNSDHIVFNEHILEIVENSILNVEIKDLIDIKDIKIKNTNEEKAHYIVVLEETDDYQKHDVTKRLANEFIRFNVYVNGEKYYNNFLNNNLKGTDRLDGLSLRNNTYLLYEGTIDKLSSTSVKVGLWIDYEDITNEYMGSAFIGTVKIYVESLS